MKSRNSETASAPPLRVTVSKTSGSQNLTVYEPFRIGRSDSCEVTIDNDYVSRVHAEVVFENGIWCIRDLNSSNGLYLDGRRVETARINGPTTIRLGVEGPEISLSPEIGVSSRNRSTAAESSAGVPPISARNPGSGTILRKYVDHYFCGAGSSAPAGEHTMYVRRAFAAVQKKQKLNYGATIILVLLLAAGAGSYAFYEYRQLQKQRAVAEDLFYTMKSLDLDIANLEKAVAASGSPQQVQMVQQDSRRRRDMQRAYDQYLAVLRVYNPKLTEQQRIMLRVARILGECELDMPADFEAEVNKYIGYWQHSDRLANAIRTAQQNDYVDKISRELLEQGLPPQFFYLALQESNFDPYASGPMTRMGIAKGMWQFVPETAMKYGLRIGPLSDLRRPDPADERDQFQKATKAAARYIKDLYATDAQASGILVMACYNWGETQVLPLVRSMPANPRERNFWRLLAHHRDQIPKETYDYVFYIFSAAVIGENPRLFGFDFDNPLSMQ
jgi:soluble lytic murein transglycosylase-like protein